MKQDVHAETRAKVHPIESRRYSIACSPRGRAALRGLSIVEVIVVIGVVAILMGVLAPALAGARLTGRATLCQSNLRQMGIAAHAYVNFYDAFPIAVHYVKSGGDLLDVSWDWVSKFGSGEVVSPGPLWQFSNDPHHVMQCPEYLGPSNTPGDPYTGYNYSIYLGGEGKFSINPGSRHIWPGVRPHAVRRPSEIAMFGLGGMKGGANKYMRSPLHNDHAPQKLITNPFSGKGELEPFLLNLQTIYSGGQAFRYRRATYVAYVDGHVAGIHRPEKGEYATEALLAQFLDHPRNGFLSDDGSAYNPLN